MPMLRCAFLLSALCFGLVACSNQPRTESSNALQKTKTIGLTSASVLSRPPHWVSDSSRVIKLSAISGEEDSSDWVAVEELDAVLDRDHISINSVPSLGPYQDLLDLLHGRKVDFGLVQADAFEALDGDLQATARERLRYLFRAPNLDLHIVAARDVAALRELDGRKVNVGVEDGGTSLTARISFAKLGIAPEFTFLDHPTALQKLRSGEIQAAVVLAARPSSMIREFVGDGQFHFVPMPIGEVTAGYLPGRFTSDDYPNLIEAGRQVGTLAVARVLAVRNWPEGSTKYIRLARLAKALHSRFQELRHPNHFARWDEVSLSAGIHGWKRFKPAQEILDSSDPLVEDRLQFRKLASASGICSPRQREVDCETFYNDFFSWRKVRRPSATVETSNSVVDR
jgi:uncharacterized protein